MSSPASSWWEASLAESGGLRGSTEMASLHQHPNSLQGWLGLLSFAATLPALSVSPHSAQFRPLSEGTEHQSAVLMTRGGKQAVPVQSEAPPSIVGALGVSTPQTRMHRWSEVAASHLCWGPALSSRSQHRCTQTSICTYCCPVPASSRK